MPTQIQIVTSWNTNCRSLTPKFNKSIGMEPIEAKIDNTQ